MKHKKLSLLATLALGVTFLSACTGMTKPTTFSDNWKTNPNAGAEVWEKLTYKVHHEPKDGLISNYKVEYKNGTYTTTLYTESKNGLTYYFYETILNIDVVYTYGNESATFTDHVKTEAEFLRSADNLRPLSSKKEFISHSPVNGAVEKLEDCYYAYDYTLVTTYNELSEALSKGTTTVTQRVGENTHEHTSNFEIEDDVRYLDNEQLLFALRGINVSSASSTATLAVYAPFTRAVQEVSAAFSTSTESSTFTFTRNGEQKERTINYRTVELSLNTKNPGSKQRLWIAEKAENNVNRNLILRMETQVSYELGSLIYTLQTEEYSEK